MYQCIFTGEEWSAKKKYLSLEQKIATVASGNEKKPKMG